MNKKVLELKSWTQRSVKLNFFFFFQQTIFTISIVKFIDCLKSHVCKLNYACTYCTYIERYR